MRQPVLRQPDTVVPDFHPELVAVPTRGDLDVAGTRLSGHAVLDGVLDERLEDQTRHAGVQGFRLDVELHRQAIRETRLLDAEILLEELQLHLQGHFVVARVVEREPQQIAEVHEGAIRGLDILVHERGDRVQRVEQEMRVELLLKRRQLRLDQLRLEL